MIYIGWFFSYFLFIRNMTVHGGYLFFLMLTIWANDVVAYFVGTKFGRTKLAPSISPKKTVEGAIVKAAALSLMGRHCDAARLCAEALALADPGSAGWILPVEPLLEAAARPEAWGEALAALRDRAA